MNNTDVALKDSDTVSQAVNQLRQLKRNMLTDFFTFGQILHALGINKGKDGEKRAAPYKLYASHITNQGEFAKEIGMSVSSLHNIVGVYLAFQSFVLNNGGVLDITPTRLIRLLPLQLDDDEKVEWVHMAAELDAKAFQNQINARKGKVTTDDCDHEDCEPWVKCKVCGDLRKQ